MQATDGSQDITAIVPLSEILDYGNSLSAITGGRASYTMERSHYDAVPPHMIEAALRVR